MSKWKKFISLEIGIEIKACLYFAIILFFYFAYRVLQGSFAADIIRMTEMVLTAYAMSYLQVYVLHNFDEAEKLDGKTIINILLCASLYTAVSVFFRWFDRKCAVTFFFFLYMILTYMCVFLIYKIKRDIDTAHLNWELEDFKKKKQKGKQNE